MKRRKSKLQRIADKSGANLVKLTSSHYRFNKQPFSSIDYFARDQTYNVVGTTDFMLTTDIAKTISDYFVAAKPKLCTGQSIIFDWCQKNGAKFLKQSNAVGIISRGKNRIKVNHILRRYEHLSTKQTGTFRGEKNLLTFLKTLE